MQDPQEIDSATGIDDRYRMRWHQEAIMSIFRDLRTRRSAVDPALVSLFLDKLTERFSVMDELAERHPEIVPAAEVELEKINTRKFLSDLLRDGAEWSSDSRAKLEAFAMKLPKELRDGALTFSADFFSLHTLRWQMDLGSLADRPNLSFLEIGSFEGRASCWLLTNILTHPTSRLTCIDTFDFAGQFLLLEESGPTIERRFDQNIAALGALDRVRKIKELSSVALRTLPLDSFDFIYVDGSHRAPDVLMDLVFGWPLLRNGGLLTADDYLWPMGRGVEAPRLAIDSFLSTFEGQWEPVHLGYQVTIRKI